MIGGCSFSTPDFLTTLPNLSLLRRPRGGPLTCWEFHLKRRHGDAVLTQPVLGDITQLGGIRERSRTSGAIFPLSEKTWSFTLFEKDWTASANINGKKAYVKATSADGGSLTFTYDDDIKFITSFVRWIQMGLSLLRSHLPRAVQTIKERSISFEEGAYRRNIRIMAPVAMLRTHS